MPTRNSPGFTDRLCATCRGRCQTCGRDLDGESKKHWKVECSPCRKPPASPGADPVRFVLTALPRPLLRALAGRIPAGIYQTISAELAHRKPTDLRDRIERRWYLRWSHALAERDPETKTPRWAPDHIALRLVAPSPCPGPDCEDGRRLATDTTCPLCRGIGDQPAT
ncbi:hypothetical protein ACH4GK_37690 [Streptomyces rimosus]|uniref:hypothetical protein n=1 Tax=Streptomyces rimosus TaxID=1927 RepID=UPI00131D8FB7|nr:hypothetical protein [Streptomyces rimosus]